MMTMYEDLVITAPSRIFKNAALGFQIINTKRIFNYKKQTAL